MMNPEPIACPCCVKKKNPRWITVVVMYTTASFDDLYTSILFSSSAPNPAECATSGSLNRGTLDGITRRK